MDRDHQCTPMTADKSVSYLWLRYVEIDVNPTVLEQPGPLRNVLKAHPASPCHLAAGLVAAAPGQVTLAAAAMILLIICAAILASSLSTIHSRAAFASGWPWSAHPAICLCR
jgi:hypothetical protein